MRLESSAPGILPETGKVRENRQYRHLSERSNLNPPHLQGQTISVIDSCT